MRFQSDRVYCRRHAVNAEVLENHAALHGANPLGLSQDASAVTNAPGNFVSAPNRQFIIIVLSGCLTDGHQSSTASLAIIPQLHYICHQLTKASTIEADDSITRRTRVNGFCEQPHHVTTSHVSLERPSCACH